MLEAPELLFPGRLKSPGVVGDNMLFTQTDHIDTRKNLVIISLYSLVLSDSYN